MIPKKLRAFAYQLRPATEKGQLSWNSADGESYYCNHKDLTLQIFHHHDENKEQSSFIFQLLKDETSPTVFSVTDNEADDYETMKNLYEAAMVDANDVSEDIANFFDD